MAAGDEAGLAQTGAAAGEAPAPAGSAAPDALDTGGPDAGEAQPDDTEVAAGEAPAPAGPAAPDVLDRGGPDDVAEPEAREAGSEPEDGAVDAPPVVPAPAGETAAPKGPVTLDHVLLETNIDDSTPELLAHAADALREAGAVDVWMSPAMMKKGRLGVVLHVLAKDADHRRLADVLFGETSTFGVRVLPVGRMYAEERRETVTIGKLKVGVRLSYVDGRLVTVSPEYEDVRRVAAAVGRPVKVVYEAAQSAARTRFSAL